MQLNTFLSLLSFSCLVIVAQTGSIEAASRILGGSYASPGQFPHQVLVQSQKDDKICGGSIISENYVVTAAHCLFHNDTNGQLHRRPVEYLSIRAGSISQLCGGTIVWISDAFEHENYKTNPKTKNDIALLKLSEPLTFSDSIQAIKLASEAPPVGASITICGWGRTAVEGDSSVKLKFNKNMKASPNIAKKLLLLDRSEGNGAWKGDSGGPAVYDNKLVGVASTASPYGTSPNTYTLVPAFYEWLYRNSDLRN